MHRAATLAGKRSAACLRSQETDRLWVYGSACRGLKLWQRGSKLFASAMNLRKPEATLHLHVSAPPSPRDGSDARTPRGKALLDPPPRDVVAMMGRVRTFRSRANWERSPATSGHSAPHLGTLLGLICRCGMAKFSAVHVDPPVTSDHDWGLAFLRHRMQ